jgi:hypothetical protein
MATEESDESPTDELHGLLQAILEDASSAEALLAAQDTQFNRRAYVRAMYATVEAFVYWLKYQALQEYERGALPHLTPADLAILREESYGLDSSGESRTRPQFVPLDANFRFVARVYLDLPRMPLVVDYGSQGWSDFRAGLKIRHRLAHPKAASDMSVSTDEVEVVRRGRHFAMSVVYLRFADAIATLRRIVATKVPMPPALENDPQGDAGS